MSTGNPRFMVTVVCDDVRQEIGNKMSIMGVYQNAIILDGFPALVSRLCFVMKAQSPADRPFERLKFVIRRDDDVLLEADLPEMQLAAMVAQEVSRPPEIPAANSADRAVQVSAVLTVSPIAFDSPCRLRFRAITESEELKGGSMLVMATPVQVPP